MGSLTRSITDLFRGKDNLAELLRKMRPACRAGTGSKRVSIKVFDRKNVLSDAAHSVSAVKQDLKAFFTHLSATASLPAPVAQDLQTFSFEVTFETRDSTKDEREGFGMMDFPVYLETTIGSTAFTTDDGEALLLAHKIPETTEVFRPTDDEGTVAREPLDPYSAIENFIPKHSAFGAGIPGTYLMENSQTRCRKIGIIKVNDLIEGINSVEIRQRRFLLVLKHELGHMFGIAHDQNTLMDVSYDEAINHPNYTIGQILIVDSTLRILTQG
jgi:hypothetical protein